MLWSDGMSAAQARKSLFGNSMGMPHHDKLGITTRTAISKYMKLANPGMFH